MTCWNVGRFVPRIVSGESRARTRSAPASRPPATRPGRALRRLELGRGRVERRPERRAQAARSPPPQNRVANGALAPVGRAACGGPCRRTTTSRRRARAAGAERLVARDERGEVGGQAAPSTGASTASASPSRRRRGPPRRGRRSSRRARGRAGCRPQRPVVDAAAPRDARGVGAGPRASTSRSPARRAARRSCVAARFIAPTTRASVCLCVAAIPAQSRSTRCTEPHDHSSSAAANPRAGLLFQFRIDPLAGSTTCACADAGDEAAPLVLAGALGRQARVDRRRAHRQPPARELRDVAVVGVEPVERHLDLRRRRGGTRARSARRSWTGRGRTSVESSSRPRVERCGVIATRLPSTVA